MRGESDVDRVPVCRSGEPYTADYADERFVAAVSSLALPAGQLIGVKHCHLNTIVYNIRFVCLSTCAA